MCARREDMGLRLQESRSGEDMRGLRELDPRPKAAPSTYRLMSTGTERASVVIIGWMQVDRGHVPPSSLRVNWLIHMVSCDSIQSLS